MRTVGSSDAHKLINVAFQRVVACNSLLTHRLASLIQRAIQFIGKTDGIILVEFVAGPQFPTHLGVPKGVGCRLADADMIAVSMCVGCNGIILTVTSIGKLQHAEYLQPSFAMLHGHVIVGCQLVITLHLAICLHAYVVALMLLRLDANDSTDLGIVLGTRRSNDIHALDVGGL